jgi:hypothetical protein
VAFAVKKYNNRNPDSYREHKARLTGRAGKYTQRIEKEVKGWLIRIVN